MKKIFRKNQLVITALALMIAVAGYFSYMNNNMEDGQVTAEASADAGTVQDTYDISEEDMLAEQEIFTDEGTGEELALVEGTETAAVDAAQSGDVAQMTDGAADVENPGEAVLTSTTIAHLDSAAEINLKENDIVNMGLAELLNAPVLIAGDIDRGGVFAQLLGTQLLLEESERRRVKGFIINKFRGDVSILAPGIRMLEERGGVPVVGVVPYMQISLEDEDSLTTRFDARQEAAVDIAVIRFPRISNFTDFSVFEQFEDVSLRYVDSVEKLHHPDMILLPGSKNTMEDLKWMRQNGLEAAILHRSAETFIFGICGGYQMLGKQIADPHGVETGGVIRGMGLLPVTTELGEQKVRTRVGGEILGGMLDGCELSGYEIHMGISRPEGDCEPFCRIRDEITGKERTDGVFAGNVCGTYVHGIFDHGSIAGKIVRHLAERKGLVLGEDGVDYGLFKEQQYDKLAATLRKYLDLDAIYKMMREYE